MRSVALLSRASLEQLPVPLDPDEAVVGRWLWLVGVGGAFLQSEHRDDGGDDGGMGEEMDQFWIFGWITLWMWLKDWMPKESREKVFSTRNRAIMGLVALKGGEGVPGFLGAETEAMSEALGFLGRISLEVNSESCDIG